MNLVRRHVCTKSVSAVAIFLVFLTLSSPLFAQTAPISDRLSPNTVFYVQWRGKAFLSGADKQNHVLQLLEDPAVAPVWQALATRLQESAQKGHNAISDAIFRDVVSFLDNPAVFGLTLDPNTATDSSPQNPVNRVGFFLVYDATGMTAMIQNWKNLRSMSAAKPSNATNYDFSGTSVEVRTSGKNTFYSALASNFFLIANQKSVIEDLITRFRGTGAPAASLSQSSAYLEMRKYLGTGNAVEFFARIPDVNQWNIPGMPGKAREDLVHSLHAEKVHAFAGGISFAEQATRIHGAVLGDTSPGGPFDLASASKTEFRTQAFVNGSSTFSMSRFDLLATYQWIRGVLVASVPPEQAAGIPGAEAMAQGFLGMPITDALALLTGEVASVTSYSDDGTTSTVFAVTIQKRESVLRILRAVLGSKIAAEDSAGSATYLDIAYPYTDPQTGTQRKTFYYVAVTPDFVFAAPRKAVLRQTVERMASPKGESPATGIFANPEFSRMRSRLPKQLSGLSGSDLSQIPWAAFLANYENEIAKSRKQTNGSQPPDLNFLNSMKPDVISQHLHMTLGGWWKDPTGVYFETYIQ